MARYNCARASPTRNSSVLRSLARRQPAQYCQLTHRQGSGRITHYREGIAPDRVWIAGHLAEEGKLEDSGLRYHQGLTARCGGLPQPQDVRLVPGSASGNSTAGCRRRAYERPSGVRNCVSEQPQPDSCIHSKGIRRSAEVRHAGISLQYMRHGLASIERRHRQNSKALLEEFKLGPVTDANAVPASAEHGPDRIHPNGTTAWKSLRTSV